jgi:hypothetical protein
MLWAMEKYFKRINPRIGDNIRVLRHELQREFGWLTRFFAYAGGPFLLWTSRREARRLTKGFRYEPPTFVERRNWAEEKC